MESASDFLIMAAVLLRLKTRALLPRSPEEDLATPTVSLDQIMDEFRRYQQVARLLSDKETERRLLYPRTGESPALNARSSHTTSIPSGAIGAAPTSQRNPILPAGVWGRSPHRD